MPIQACPICIIKADGCIPPKVAPIAPDLGYFGHIEEYQTLGEVLTAHNAKDPWNIDPNTPVISTWKPVNTWCGGESILGITLANATRSRMFGTVGCSVYLSKYNGKITLEIPA